MSEQTPIAIAGSRLSATVSAFGAELRSLKDAAGRDLLWDGDPAYWTGRAPLLFPIVGRLVDDRYVHAGASYSLPQHGFARRRLFAVERAAADSVTLVLADDAETRAVYPFAFRLAITHRIDDDRLTSEAVLTNTGPVDLPASFGFHPAFRWPLPGGGAKEDHAVVFEHDERAPILRPTAEGQLDPVAEPSPVRDRRLALDDGLFARGALVFTTLASRSLRYGVDGGPGLEVAFEGMPHLGLWTKPGAGAPYLCIEPWQGHADTVGHEGPFADRPGTVILPPGGERRFAMSVRPLA